MDVLLNQRAMEAANALIALGWPIVIYSDQDGIGWRIGDSTFTDEELLEFAAWMEVATVVERPK